MIAEDNDNVKKIWKHDMGGGRNVTSQIILAKKKSVKAPCILHVLNSEFDAIENIAELQYELRSE